MSRTVENGKMLICDGGERSIHRCPEGVEQEAERIRRVGLKYGYPPCCVEEFVTDLMERGHLPATRRMRAVAPSGRGVYIVCYECEKRMVGVLFSLKEGSDELG